MVRGVDVPQINNKMKLHLMNEDKVRNGDVQRIPVNILNLV